MLGMILPQSSVFCGIRSIHPGAKRMQERRAWGLRYSLKSRRSEGQDRDKKDSRNTPRVCTINSNPKP